MGRFLKRDDRLTTIVWRGSHCSTGAFSHAESVRNIAVNGDPFSASGD
jgi:hypothetical protein